MTPDSSQNDRKIAVFLADGCEEIEALTVVDLLTRAGLPHTTVSITDHHRVVSSHKVPIEADALISEIDFREYDMLVLPGGMPGTTHLEDCEELTRQVSYFAQHGREVAAICAAPQILAHLGLLKGRVATCNPSRDQTLAESGAILTHNPVEVDGNLITSRGMGTAIPFGLAIVEHYLGRQKAGELREKILY